MTISSGVIPANSKPSLATAFIAMRAFTNALTFRLQVYIGPLKCNLLDFKYL
jgi:hypothetical protein